MKKYKIAALTWQIMHYYDLFNALKEDADFYLIDTNHRDWRDKRFQQLRPIPENAHFIPYYQPGKYDFAILNVDQQVTDERLGKAKVIHDLNKEIQDIPKVFINHASPVYPELYATQGRTFEEAEEDCRQRVRELVGDNPMIVNSYQATSKAEWGWGYPIWHGMDVNDWYDLPKEPRVFSALSPAGIDEYYNREAMNRIFVDMEKFWGYKMYWAKQNIGINPSWNFHEYRTYLGKSLIYLDMSFRTPMNRARCEAMLSGCCVVQVKGAHDIERFAKDKENMILVDNSPKQVCQILMELLNLHYDKCVEIGQAGKKTAMELFNRKRYREDWLTFIHNVLKI